jgi:hypothetical protein
VNKINNMEFSMNQVQLQVQKTISNWFETKNKYIQELDDPELTNLLQPYKDLKDAGVMVNYGENGCVAFDGEILSALRGCAEYGWCEKLAESLTDLFYNNDYEDFGFGVWNHCEYEGGK